MKQDCSANEGVKILAVGGGHGYKERCPCLRGARSGRIGKGCISSIVSSNLFFSQSTNCSSTDPLLVDLQNDDFHLQSGSPCIDAAAEDLADPTDIEGQHRYDDPTTPNSGRGTPSYVDIGAYEYH